MDIYKYTKSHDILNSKLWDGLVLKPEVEEKMRDIVEAFKNMCNKNDMCFEIKDILFVGSNTGYNYNENSDIDLHILISLPLIEEKDKNMYFQLISNYRTLFNQKYDPLIYDISVEIYVELDSTEHSESKYSLLYGWVKKPHKSEKPELNSEEANAIYDSFVEEFEQLKENISFKPLNEKEESINNLLAKIYEARQEALFKYGEFGAGNIAFKELRAKGYIETLKQLKEKVENAQLKLSTKK